MLNKLLHYSHKIPIDLNSLLLMSNPSSPLEVPEPSLEDTTTGPVMDSTERQPSYVKLAMRNMVRKRGTSLKHFFLTTVGLLAVLVGLAYLTR